jgi:hypothetical protein
MRQGYKVLAVLLEDMTASMPILQTLWNLTEAETRRTSRHLVDRSLAQWDGTAEAIRLNDLQLDFTSHSVDRQPDESTGPLSPAPAFMLHSWPKTFSLRLVG